MILSYTICENHSYNCMHKNKRYIDVFVCSSCIDHDITHHIFTVQCWSTLHCCLPAKQEIDAFRLKSQFEEFKLHWVSLKSTHSTVACLLKQEIGGCFLTEIRVWGLLDPQIALDVLKVSTLHCCLPAKMLSDCNQGLGSSRPSNCIGCP